MPKQNPLTTNKSSLASQRNEVLEQPEFEQSYDERVDVDQEGFDPGKLEDSAKLGKLLQKKSEPTSSSEPESQRSDGTPNHLTEEEVQRAADLY